MNAQIKIKIGEFSRLNQVTIKTLRYYEEIELLIPYEIDNYSGYRYYTVTQMQTMSKIRYYKKLGFSLEEIKFLFEQTDCTPSTSMIKEKINACRNEIKKLQERKSELLELQKHIKNKETMENYQIKSLPKIIVASHREVIKSYQDLFNLCPNVIGPEMVRLGCKCSEPGYCYTVDHNKEYQETDIDIEYCEQITEMIKGSDIIEIKEIPAVEKALCYKHYGPYSNFPQSWAGIYSYLEKNGYNIIDSPRFSYIDGIWNKENENDWLTEIQVPIA